MNSIKRNALLVSVILIVLIAFTRANLFYDSNSENFNNGTYIGTTYNGTSLIINSTNLNGIYISRVFDSGSDFTGWNNITFGKITPNNSILFAVDIQADVWNSIDMGINWTLIKDDLTGAEANGADDIAVNSTNSIFILNTPQIWVSNNKGQNWTKINNDFNPGSSSNGLAMTVNSNNSVFVADASGAIWASYNSGVNFTKINVSFNSGGANPSKMTSNSTGSLFIVDNQAKIWSSNNGGLNWINLSSDFNGASVSNVGADGMRVNGSDALYIVDRQKLWSSIDNGVSWTNVNDDFNGGGVGVSAFSMNIDQYNRIYLIDGNEDVYSSNNSGVNFTKIASNFNGANNATRAFHSVVSNSNITYQIRNCTSSCTNEQFFGPDLTNSSYYINSTFSLNLTGRYIQYKIFMSRKDVSVEPFVYNVSIDYSFLNTAPEISLVYPLTGNYSYLITSINYTVSDVNLQSCWYSTDYGTINTSVTCGNNITGLTSLQGANFWSVYANDSAGLTGSANVTFYIDTIGPEINFNDFSPQSGISTNNRSLSIGVNANDSNFANTTIYLYNSTGLVYYNTSSSTSFNITYSGLLDGDYFFNATSFDLFNNHNSTQTRNISIDNTAPELMMVSPSEGSAYGYNISINLNFTIIDNNLDKCWYRIDSSIDNIIIPNCQNTTFNVSNGNHVVYLFANDTLGNIAMGDSSFFVQVDAPSIEAHFPINSYLSYTSNIALNYTPSDFDLDSCSLLLGTSDGDLNVNQTTHNLLNGSVNSFFVNLADHEYVWAISCNDTSGHNATTGNFAFYVDTIKPSVVINAPSGTYSSLSNIPLNILINDSSPVKCYYNITFAATGNVVIGNTELLNCEATTFTLDTQSSYHFNLLVNDSAGNSNLSKSLFTVSIPQGGSSSGGGGGGSRSSESSGSIGRNLANLKLEALDKLRITRGKSELIELSVTNDGNKFLNNCRFNAKGGISKWISGEEVYSLSPGQTINYIFNVNVPIDSEKGEYFTTLELICNEINSSTTLSVDVVGGDFELNILKSERVGTKLRFTYNINNFANEEKTISSNYKLVDKKSKVVAEGFIEPVKIPAGQLFEGNHEFELPKNSIGDYILLMEASDGRYASKKQQQVRLSKSGISGFAISDANYRAISWFGIILALSGGIFIVIKMIRKQLAIRRVIENNEREFIKLDFNYS